MSLHLILGNSGGGKTCTLYETVIREACAFPDRTFLVIVPEQFTLETQRELTAMHPGGSLCNIDILSFQRLGHRLLEEAGIDDRQVLDDTGKNLILRRIADRRRGELKLLGAHLDRMGMIDEIKSFLSELMQYGLAPGDLDRMIDEAQHTSLKWKLEDIRLLYTDFLEEIEGKALTAESLLMQMGRLAADSELLRGSVIALDGYTGFTPVQNTLLASLMRSAQDLYVTVTIDAAQSNTQGISYESLKSLTREGSMTDLFYLSRRTIRRLIRLALDEGVDVADPVWCTDGANCRFRHALQLYHLEQHLFRSYEGADAVYMPADGEVPQVLVRACTEPRDELACCLQEIKRQVTAGRAGYGDFAIMTGDLSRYEYFAPELFAAYEVPCFLDRTRRLDYHPLPQALSALLQIISDDFSYRSVFGFLRSGFGPLEEEEIDRLENHVLAAGVRGYSAWRRAWRRNPLKLDEEAFSSINDLRGRFVESIAPLWEAFAGHTAGNAAAEKGLKSRKVPDVRQMTKVLYQFLIRLGVPEELERRALAFRESADPVRAREEEQIWPLLMQLLEKLVDVLGDSTVSAEEYRSLLEAGFSASCLRVAPPRTDTVVFGDMERTRLNHIQTLFLIGANDGVIPRISTEGGILSEFERQSLKDAGEELADTARETALLQNFYLYQNLTKPERSLWITYAQRGSDGAALRRSSLIGAVEKLYAQTPEEEQRPDALMAAGTDGRWPDALLTVETSLAFFARESGRLAQEEGAQPAPFWPETASYYKGTDPWRVYAERILDSACENAIDSTLTEQTSRSLYGDTLRTSVSRLEQYASCPFSHFAQYGLILNERQIASFEATDMGDLLHDAVRNYTRCVQEAASDPDALSDEAHPAYFRQTDAPLRPFHDVTDAGIDHYAQVAMNMALAERAADRSGADRGAGIGSDDLSGSAPDGRKDFCENGAAGTSDRLTDLRTDEAFARELTQAAFDTASDRQIAERLQRVFTRTAHVVTEQVKAGSFEPVRTEVPFRMRLELSGGRQMRLSGRIDRVDMAQIRMSQEMPDTAQGRMDGGRSAGDRPCRGLQPDQPGGYDEAGEPVTAVRIVDYKSSEKDFRYEELYEGLSLQLPLYLEAVTEEVQNHPDIDAPAVHGMDKGWEDAAPAGVLPADAARTSVVPAGMYYYAMLDPVLDEKMGESREERNARLKKELRLSGVTSRQDEVIEATEPLPPGRESIAVNLKLNTPKPNEPDNPAALVSKNSRTLPPADLRMLSSFAKEKAVQMGDAIAGGQISVSPRRMGQERTSCSYCPYRSLCGFDRKDPRYRYRESELNEQEALGRIRQTVRSQGAQP